jgi:hypothetical protein
MMPIHDVMAVFLKYGCQKCMKIILIPSRISWPGVCETLAKNGRLDALRYAI